MRKIKLVTIDGKTIYEAAHDSINEAIEFAIAHNIPMDGVDLSNANLKNINLDGAQFKNASFKGADLSGANMSEADFTNCNFSDATMIDTCLCYSNLNHCNLKYAHFGATDMSMASLESCSFAGVSTFQIHFHSAFQLSNLTYHHYEKAYAFHGPPTFVKSGDNCLIILGTQIISTHLGSDMRKNHTATHHLKTVIDRMQSAIVSG